MIPTAMVSPAGQTHRIIASMAACRRNRLPFLRLSSVNVDRTDCVASDPYSSVNVFGMISVFVFVDTSMSSYEKPIDFYSCSQLKEVGGPRIFNSAFPFFNTSVSEASFLQMAQGIGASVQVVQTIFVSILRCLATVAPETHEVSQRKH